MLKLHFLQFLYIILAAVIIQGCVTVPSDVVMPQWDTNLNVPFATKSYTLADIIKSQNYISISAAQDSVFIINSDTYSQTVSVGNFIQVKIGLPISNIQIPTINTELPPVLLPFPEGAQIDSATFVSGTIQITGTTPPTNTAAATLSIRIPGVFNPNGTAMALSVTVQPNSTNSATYTFAPGSRYVQPSAQYSTGFELIAKASGPSNGLVTFSATASDFVFSSVTGYLPTKSLGTQNNNFSLNLGDASKYRGKVTLKTGTLTLSGKYNSPSLKPFIVQVKNLQVQGVRNNGGGTMNLSYNIPLTTFTFDSTGTLNPPPYTESNSNITSFITFLPDAINISAEYIMNPDNSLAYRTANSSDMVSFTTSFSTKSLLAIQQTSFVDTLKLDISQDARDQIVKGQGVTAIADIQNAIALNSWVKVTLTDANYKPLFVVTRDTIAHADSISFTGAAVDNNGNVTTPALSNTIISLDSTQIRLLAQSAHYAFVSVTVSTSGANNAPVLVRAKDWIKLNVYGSVNYRIKGNN